MRTTHGAGRRKSAALRVLLAGLVVGKSAGDCIFPTADFRREWQQICGLCGISSGKRGIVFHDIRRSSARAKRASGVPAQIVMEIQGWKTAAMLHRYSIVDRLDKLEALEKVAGGLA